MSFLLVFKFEVVVMSYSVILSVFEGFEDGKELDEFSFYKENDFKFEKSLESPLLNFCLF